MGKKELENLVKGRNKDKSDFVEATDNAIEEDKPVRDTKYVALLPNETWKALMRIATMTNVSANEYVNQLVEQFVKEHQAENDEYVKMWNGKGKYS